MEIDVKSLAAMMNGAGKGNSSHSSNNKNNKKNNGCNNNRNNSNNKSVAYVGAPYNFVSLSNKVIHVDENKLVPHNTIDNDLYSGEISYTMTAHTPIMVDDGTEYFNKNSYGQYAIQGSTIRGLIRNNVQILGLSSVKDDIDDYSLMYRNVANGIDKKRYDDILGARQLPINDGEKSYGIGVLQNVKAGYVSFENGKYIIYQTEIDSIKKEFKSMNYYAVSERNIVNSYLKNRSRFRYEFFIQNGKSIMQHEFEYFKKEEDRRGNIHYKGTKNNDYKPFIKIVSYDIANQKNVIAVGNSGKYQYEGYAMSTGKMNEKKVIYIIPKIDKTKETIEIGSTDIASFKTDINKRENTLKQFGGREFFDLPKEGTMKPVFYIQLGGRLYFGFTPRLRLFYDYTIKDGIKDVHNTDKLDLCKSMFGYSGDKKSYKSKVSFSDAVINNESSYSEKKVLLAEPKATSYMDYLKQDGRTESTYNTDGFEIRGIKQYWLHENAVEGSQDNKNENVKSTMHPLDKGAVFTGKVRYQNLTYTELGLLLWSIRLEKNSHMNVGKAKSYGYGNIKVEITDAKMIDCKQAYNTDMLNFSPFKNIDVDKVIDNYKDYLKAELKVKDVKDCLCIKEFFKMKDASKILNESRIHYMKLEEYRNRRPLPKVGEMIHDSE